MKTVPDFGSSGAVVGINLGYRRFTTRLAIRLRSVDSGWNPYAHRFLNKSFWVIQVFLSVTRSVFYSMSLPLALCQWRRNLQLQVHKMCYRGHLALAGLPASWREDRPGQGSSLDSLLL